MTWLDALEERARSTLPEYVYGYYAMTAGTGTTHAEGLRDWAAFRLQPRVLSDVCLPVTATTLLGTPVQTPVLIAPVAQTGAAHPHGDFASATAAEKTGSLVGVSTHTATRFDRITAAGAPWWYQVYVMRDRGLTAALVQRARDAGARALILTVDLPTLQNRTSSLEPGNWPDQQLAHRGVNADELDGFAGADRGTADDVDLDTIGWLQGVSGLPVVVKGVLRADDALRATQAGARGVLVSTHGGRAVDRSVTSAGALPLVVTALRDTDAEVYVDSGIRSGTDVLAALALGARAVFLGRPVLWGLATGGAAGVTEVIERITAELTLAMTFAGAASLTDISRDALR